MLWKEKGVKYKEEERKKKEWVKKKGVKELYSFIALSGKAPFEAQEERKKER